MSVGGRGIGNICDIKGQKFGKLTVLKFEGVSKNQKAIWTCLCDCGNEVRVISGDLRSGNTTSCGCYKHEVHTTHNGAQTRLYNTWKSIKARCYQEKSKNYKKYGAKGVKVCEEWRNNFENFRTWALANGYNEVLTIDRIDPYGDYDPKNCRWITNLEQQRNKRNTTWVTIDGETKSIVDWAEIFGVNYKTARTRYVAGKRGKDLFIAVKR